MPNMQYVHIKFNVIWVYLFMISDPISRVSESPECPSPPPRRNRGSSSRHGAATNGETMSPRGGVFKHGYPGNATAKETSADDSNLRSPSMRKRDAMMRRYNSASVLPTATSSDVNKNHILPSREQFSLGGSRNKDWDSTYQDQSSQQNSHHESYGNQTQNLCQVDIVGESFEARFPWQRDISTQCDIPGERGSVSSSGSGSGGSDGSYNVQTHSNEDRNSVNRRSSHDSVRRRHNFFKNRRPRSMTSLESSLRHSDMYRSDTNINYSGQRRTASDPTVLNTSNRKRMPILIADDPGSVSDLESILENPNDK